MIALLGGFCSTAVVITFPGLMYYKLSGKKISDYWLFTVMFFTIFLTLMGWASGIVALLNMINVIDLKSMA